MRADARTSLISFLLPTLLGSALMRHDCPFPHYRSADNQSLLRIHVYLAVRWFISVVVGQANFRPRLYHLGWVDPDYRCAMTEFQDSSSVGEDRFSMDLTDDNQDCADSKQR
ncbi:hypothetical protein B0H16DRAFT_1559620 [Mycena metata]|uniref:Uncharacterized protein n=1 Tax=Mycena metata TaxID=1033252 RepID=A0AAD7N4Y6_9AGAR|nr:hypothetical protein B0H16DRAFT_1559620 [Mycena metata]